MNKKRNTETLEYLKDENEIFDKVPLEEKHFDILTSNYT